MSPPGENHAGPAADNNAEHGNDKARSIRTARQRTLDRSHHVNQELLDRMEGFASVQEPQAIG